MSSFLKALAWVAPNAVMRRMHAASVIDARAARYAGAQGGRRAGSWSNGSSTANSAIAPALSTLRNRSREMVRDHWAFKRILDVLVGHIVGAGISIVPDNGKDSVDREARAVFDEWARSADITEENNLEGLIALMVRSSFEGGESVLRFIDTGKDDSRRVKLGLQLWEGDIIDAARDGDVGAGKFARLGVQLGEQGQREGYWLHKDYPGEARVSKDTLKSSFVARESCIHLFKQERAGQVRGVPIFAPILMSARDLADLMDAVIVKAKIEACFATFITSTNDGPLDPLTTQQPGVTGIGSQITEIAPGMVAKLAPGEDVKFGMPGNGGAFFEPTYNAALYAMAAGAGVTYDQMTGNLTQANYSSLRAGKIEFRRLVEQYQWLTLVPKALDRIMDRFNSRAVLSGALPRRARDGYRWKYVMPANEPIDPKKDLEADILAVRSGRMSPQEFIAGWGRDWREVIADFGAFMTEIDAMNGGKGLMFDIDPRKTSQSGIEQPSVTLENTPEPTAPAAK